jgi:glutaminyl-tRNA synthetase
MASPNMNMRDPAIYRIRHAHHHRTGDKWCIYPMYDFAHPLEDAIEKSHTPFVHWNFRITVRSMIVIQRAAEGGFFQQPVPQQYEFARLNLTYVVTSKRARRTG